ncbi:uncharacterized protein [Argopecten irradians]|uniref:uncharacterized protein isoform X2 n=1 Tax=Argopecten irradians TaxID=31199 RepID=UPI00371B5412
MDVIVGFCVPKDAVLRIKTNGIESSNSVASYGELARESSELKYFHNKTEGIIFMNLGRGNCTQDYYGKRTGQCRAIDVKVTNGETGNNNCDITQYQPTAPPTTSTRAVGSETRELESKAKSRLVDLIEKLIALESENVDETLKRRRRSLADPDRTFPRDEKPEKLGECV